MKRTKLVAFGLTLALLIAPHIAVAQSLDELVQQGNGLQEAKKYPEAESIWRKVIQLYPDEALSYYGLGNALYYQNKLDGAIIQYRKAIELHHEYAEAYKGLGDALYSQKKLDEAIIQYRKAVELTSCEPYSSCVGPPYMDAINSLKDALYHQKKRDSDAHNNLGLLLQKQGKLQKAIKEFEQAITIDPDFYYAQNNLQEARRKLALQQQPANFIALNETKYLPADDPLTVTKRSVVKIIAFFPGNSKGTEYGTGYVIKREGDKV